MRIIINIFPRELICANLQLISPFLFFSLLWISPLLPPLVNSGSPFNSSKCDFVFEAYLSEPYPTSTFDRIILFYYVVFRKYVLILAVHYG